MPNIKIQETIFTLDSALKKEVENYITLIEENCAFDIAKDLKLSLAEKLSTLSKDKQITKEILDATTKEIGDFEKPIYKQFFRSRGIFGGICSGIARYFKIPVWITRLLIGFFPLFLLIVLIDTNIYYIFPNLPYFESIFRVSGSPDFWLSIGSGSPTIWFKQWVIDLIDFSISIIFYYILIWFFTPKANTEVQNKQLNSDLSFSEELKKAIFNKITFKNLTARRLATNFFVFIAKFLIFIFDITISVVNNIFKSLFLGVFGVTFTIVIIIVSSLAVYVLTNIFWSMYDYGIVR